MSYSFISIQPSVAFGLITFALPDSKCYPNPQNGIVIAMEVQSEEKAETCIEIMDSGLYSYVFKSYFWPCKYWIPYIKRKDIRIKKSAKSIKCFKFHNRTVFSKVKSMN
jgi:hypothetical protein